MKPNREPLISVVLPTYNVAQYLQQCLESVAAQTYGNIEVIIIIDGATDGSYEIAQDFCKTDKRFSVFWQENAGSGPARNAGLAHCQGEFVMFVDPDDWIEPELLEKLYEAQQDGDYDLVASRRIFVSCNEAGNIIRINKRHYSDKTIANQNEVRMAYMKMLELAVVSAPTEKLYKMSLIREHDITFPPLRRSQDVVFNYRYYNHIYSVRLISYSGYNYRLISQHAYKTPPDYMKTIRQLYSDCEKMYKGWSLPFPEQEMCTFFFRTRLYAHLQGAVADGWDIPELLNDDMAMLIAEKATPDKWYLQLARRLILAHFYTTLYLFLKTLQFVKKNVLHVTRVQGELK